ncbi:MULTISPECIES: hypothetical protein [unclassified Rathayibacter]|uniref:hypothetical protein n=1 Tax=unclassified Rathayibacter TaxID=2609250 RepID=UPI001046904D|nr:MULTISPECIES: hypothetical protein [unclassified Rathayibacter]
MTPVDVLEQLPVSSRAAWQLYLDWCAATDAVAVPATLAELGRFFAAVPAAPATAITRVRALRLGHLLLGAPFPVAPMEPARAVRVGAGWVSATHALQAIPITRYPAGLIGRRDAFLLLLLDQLHLTRAQARVVVGTDVAVEEPFTIAGAIIAGVDDAASCWRCVMTRWLRVLGPAALGFRYSVREILDPTLHSDTHDCATAVPDDWRSAPTLLPAIDQHGWLNPQRPLSTRAMSTITAHRQNATLLPADNRPRPRLTPSTSHSLQDLADGYDDIDVRLAALLQRTATLLADSDDIHPK